MSELIPTHEMDVTEDEAWQLLRVPTFDEDFFRRIYIDDRPGSVTFRSDLKTMPGLVVRFIHRETPIVTARVLDTTLPEDQEDIGENEDIADRRTRLELYLEGYFIHPRLNTGHHSDRIAKLEPGYNDIERAFADEWLQECTPHPGINYGNGILQDLFLGNHRPPIDHQLLSDREHMIVATVIQWLGTNCGRSFLKQVNMRTNNQLAKSIQCIERP